MGGWGSSSSGITGIRTGLDRVAEEDDDENWTVGRQEEEGILGGQIRGRSCEL